LNTKLKNKLKELIISAQAGDLEARNKAIEIVIPKIKEQCYYNHDCLQESIIRIITYFPSFDVKKGSLEDWVCKISKNKRIELLEEESYITLNYDEFIDSVFSKKNYSFDEKESSKKLLYCINRLPSRQSECFKLRVIYNVSYKEIAELKNISINAVIHHISKAKKRLRKNFIVKERYKTVYKKAKKKYL